METQFIVSTLLPLSLAIIMLGFGLALTPADFARVLKYPKSVLVGLLCQMILLPALGVLICKVFNFPPELAVGLMILAASPGGITANIFSHLSHGDIALNLTLTALNSVLAAFTLPLFVNLSIAHFMGSDQSIGLQFQKTIEVFMIVLVPVIVGMGLRHWKPVLAVKADKPVRIFSMLILIVLIVGAIGKERAQMAESFAQIGWAMLLFNLASMAVGYVVPLALKLRHQEATAIAMEVGVHNGTLALYIAMSVLGSFTLALPAAVYSVIMFITAAGFSFILAKKNKRPA
jgi:bile acid:Na+ symporter, BASS family